MIDTSAIEGDPAAWLEAIREDEERRAELVEGALVHAARALAARRVASRRPGDPGPDPRTPPLAIRVGYGDGDALVDGRYDEALELPRDDGPPGPRRRAAPAGADGGAPRRARARRSSARS